METSYSGANHAGLQAQNDRWVLEPIDTSNSGANGAVFLMLKTIGEVWDP